MVLVPWIYTFQGPNKFGEGVVSVERTFESHCEDDVPFPKVAHIRGSLHRRSMKGLEKGFP